MVEDAGATSSTTHSEVNTSVTISSAATTLPASLVTTCSNSTAHVTSEFSSPFINTQGIPPASAGVTLTQVVTAPPAHSIDMPHPQDGAYGGFMVVLPPPTTTHPHGGEMTEYQRSQLQKHQQHLILYGLTHAHPKPYPGCPNLPSVNVINDDLAPPKVDINAPPAYETVASPPTYDLPTYEDVQREKHYEQAFLNGGSPNPLPPHSNAGRNSRPMTFLATIDGENGRDADSDALLGTDFMFITAFIVAFLFNWIGFLLIICFCHTVAARYGALSGFGVSLAKWTFIVRTSTEVTSHENDWLWWLIMAFGCLICIRAFLQYITIKRSWNTLSEQAQERFFFIY